MSSVVGAVDVVAGGGAVAILGRDTAQLARLVSRS